MCGSPLHIYTMSKVIIKFTLSTYINKSMKYYLRVWLLQGDRENGVFRKIQCQFGSYSENAHQYANTTIEPERLANTNEYLSEPEPS